MHININSKVMWIIKKGNGLWDFSFWWAFHTNQPQLHPPPTFFNVWHYPLALWRGYGDHQFMEFMEKAKCKLMVRFWCNIHFRKEGKIVISGAVYWNEKGSTSFTSISKILVCSIWGYLKYNPLISSILKNCLRAFQNTARVVVCLKGCNCEAQAPLQKILADSIFLNLLCK